MTGKTGLWSVGGPGQGALPLLSAAFLHRCATLRPYRSLQQCTVGCSFARRDPDSECCVLFLARRPRWDTQSQVGYGDVDTAVRPGWAGAPVGPAALLALYSFLQQGTLTHAWGASHLAWHTGELRCRS